MNPIFVYWRHDGHGQIYSPWENSKKRYHQKTISMTRILQWNQTSCFANSSAIRYMLFHHSNARSHFGCCKLLRAWNNLTWSPDHYPSSIRFSSNAWGSSSCYMICTLPPPACTSNTFRVVHFSGHMTKRAQVTINGRINGTLQVR